MEKSHVTASMEKTVRMAETQRVTRKMYLFRDSSLSWKKIGRVTQRQ